MKNMLSLIIVAALVLCMLCACGDDSKDPAKTTATIKATIEKVITPSPTPTQIPTPAPTPTPSIPTIILSEGKKATSSGAQDATYPEEYAMDGDITTRWSGYIGNKTNLWYMVDLEEICVITDAYISFEALTMPFKIDISETGEEGSWKDIYDEMNELDEMRTGYITNLEYEIDFPKDTKARFVRIYTYLPEDELEPTGSWYHSIYEIEINGLKIETT